MREEEAKTKWCPHIQVTAAQSMNDVEYGDNRGNGDENHNCIASDCMMWKWDIILNRELAADKINRDDYEGYCGLAK